MSGSKQVEMGQGSDDEHRTTSLVPGGDDLPRPSISIDDEVSFGQVDHQGNDGDVEEE